MGVRGFTLIELVVVLSLVSILAEARTAALHDQARNLVSNNSLNVAACRAGSPECIEFGVTGFDPGVCQESIRLLLPEAGTRFEATTYSSSIPQAQWPSLPGPDEALFWITRTVPVPFPQTVPCTLRFADA
jgi:prepilin-type N-terminal cleavage/methylation domain-containing protein